MKSLNSDQVFYAFSPELQPRLTVAQGENFLLCTKDCFSGQLTSDEDTVDSLDWSTMNPATGPVFVEGVKPGDLLRIDIRSLKLDGRSVMASIPGAGKVNGVLEAETRVMEVADGELKVRTGLGEVSLPVSPMIGVIGVAPAEGSIENGVPDHHGGNMDCRLIGEGTTLYLHAGTEGALFGCGDVHSVMGDGEVDVCGGETPAKVELSISVKEGLKLRTPFLETEELYAAIACSESLEEACQSAIGNMFCFLTENAGLSAGDAGRLMSLAGELKFCQVVDPKYSVRFEFPKAVLKELGFAGI